MKAIAATDCDGYAGQELMPEGEPFAAPEQAYRVRDVQRIFTIHRSL